MSPFRVLVAVTGLVVLGVFAHALDDLVRYGGADQSFGWTEAPAASAPDASTPDPEPPLSRPAADAGTPRSGPYVITSVDPSGPAAGLLQPGDRLVSLNGDTLVARYGTRYARTTEPVGWRYTLRVERDVGAEPAGQRPPGGGQQARASNQQLEFELTVAPGPRRTAFRWTMFFVSLVWCVVGLFIGFAKPDDPVARLACLAAVATGLVFVRTGALPQSLPGHMFQPIHMVLGYHFFYRFPGGIGRGKASRALLWTFYVWAGIPVLIYQSLNWFYFTRGPGATAAWAAQHAAVFKWSWALATALMVPLVMAAVALVASTYSRITDAQRRRRIRWIVFSGAIGLAPQLLWAAQSLVGQLYSPAPSPIPLDLRRAVSLATNAGTVVIPLGVAYAVVKHRVFDIAVVIRRGLQYLLARRALQLLLALPAAALILTAVVHRDRTIGELVSQNAVYLWLMVAVGLSLRYRRPLGRWLDRRFFREQYDREQVLTSLLADLSRLTRPGDVSPLVMAQLDYALRPSEVRVWFEGDPDPPPEALLSRLAHEDVAPDAPLTGDSSLPAGVSLAVPLRTGADDPPAGVLMLGERRSEEPYSPQDLALLGAVAKQAAMVRENLLLRKTVTEERRIRADVLAHLGPDRAGLVKECPSCGLCYDSTEERCKRDREQLGLFLPVGRRVAGRYRLDARIGRGGMGAVYEALDLRLRRTVAVKFLLGPALGREESLKRFRREARAVARIHHPNIVAVFDYGGLEPHGAYLVMERIRGVTLREELTRRGTLSAEAAAAWFGPILDGIEAAHREGVIHRDLKPENVVRVAGDPAATQGHPIAAQANPTAAAAGNTTDGHATTATGGPAAPGHGASDLVKILDFGVAKIRPADTASENLTATGAVVGTLGYMAPEQLRGLEVDARTDLFALGVMVVEALTGRWPFTGESYSELLASIVLDPYRLPGDDPGIGTLDRVLQRCLAKDPGDRYRSAAELRQALVPALRECPPLS